MHVVIDTNVILDLFLYSDPRARDLLAALNSGQLQWLATCAMREELARVLKYEHIQKRLMQVGTGAVVEAHASLADFADAQGLLILAHMDAQATYVQAASRASYVCKDVDDQKFIDLAQAHRALLISKDKAVLSMKNRMAKVGVRVMGVYLEACTLQQGQSYCMTT